MKNTFPDNSNQKGRAPTNTLVIGTDIKTCPYVKQEILQSDTSLVISDPGGELFEETGQTLAERGYEVKTFNLKDMEHSGSYNPFRYIHGDGDIPPLVRCIMKNTNNPNPTMGPSGGRFYEIAEENLFLSLFYYIVHECRDEPEKQNLITIVDLIQQAIAKKGDRTEMDLIFEDLEVNDPDNIAVRHYKIFKAAAGKTLITTLVSASLRIVPCKVIRSLIQDDTMHLEEIGTHKQAVFIITACDSTYNFFTVMMYTQIFRILAKRGDTGTGPVFDKAADHVHLILNEFANIGYIPDFDVIMATIRSYRASVTIVLQTLKQLKTLYGREYATILESRGTKLELETDGGDWS
jgi:type IV secretion system protein VirD4